MSVRISKKHGLNPSIPLCHYCGKPKNEIILTGAHGETWAKKHGITDGQMPMYVVVEGDIEPCAECKKAGIGIAEVESETDFKFTGRVWLISEKCVNEILTDGSLKTSVLQKRFMVVDKVTAQKLGL